MDIAPVIGMVGALVFVARLLEGIFSRTKIPDVLILMVVGILLGPVLGITSPAKLGQVGPIFTVVTLIVILFESGLNVRLEDLRKSASLSGILTTASFVLTALVVALAAHFMGGLPPLLALMTGAALGGTSSAVVVPMLRCIEIKQETRSALTLESVLSDMLCIVVALSLFEAYGMGTLHVGLMTGRIISAFVLASLMGSLSGLLWSAFLRKVRSAGNSIHTTPAFVLIVFSVAEILGYSGAIASLAFGITLGNVREFRMPLLRRFLPHKPVGLNEGEKVFFTEIVFLLKTFFFIYIGISVQFNDLSLALLGFYITVLVFLVRIPAVRMAVKGTALAGDAPIMGVMVPKGLAAAVIAMIPVQRGLPEGGAIAGIVFSVILFSIIASSVMVFVLHRAGPGNWYERLFGPPVGRGSRRGEAGGR